MSLVSHYENGQYLEIKIHVTLFVFGNKTHLLCMDIHVIQTMIDMNFPKRKSRNLKIETIKIEIDMCIYGNTFDIIWSNFHYTVKIC